MERMVFVLTLFLFGADTQFRYLNKIKPWFFPPLAIEIEAGRCSRTCPIYLDDWLVSTLLTRFVGQRHNVISCVSELEKDDPKILLDEMRFIAHLPSIVSPSCLPLLNTMPRALHEI